MPIIYLSPSTQEKNEYVNGGTEEQYMNLLADKMVPYLDASGIRYVRNTPEMTAASSIAASNRGNYDLHLACTPTPRRRGSTARCGDPGVLLSGQSGGRAGCHHYRQQSEGDLPLPELVQAQPTTTLGEVRRVRLPPPFWSWATTTIRRTRRGSKAAWTRWPKIWSSL